MEIADFKKRLAAKGEIYLRVKVRPGAEKTELKDIMADDTLKIDVAAPAEKGKANLALVGYLANAFIVREPQVKIISGAGDKLKLIRIEF